MPPAQTDFALLFATLPGALFAVTPAGRVVAASDALLAVLAAERGELVDRDLEALAGAHWAARAGTLLEQVRATRAPALAALGGGERLRATPVLAADTAGENPAGENALAYVLFVLETAQPSGAAPPDEPAEEAEPSSERLHAFSESLGFGVVIQDAKGLVTYANRAATELLGLSLEQLRGLTSADPHWRITKEDGTPDPPDNHPVSRARLTGESVRGVLQGVYSGSEHQRWILTDAVPIKDAAGELQEAVVSFVDVTERVHASAQLQRERDFSDALLAALPDVFYLAAPDGTFVRWNRRLEEVSGYSAKEIAALDAFTLTPEPLRPALRRTFHQVLEAGSAASESELLSKRGARLAYALTGGRFAVDDQDYLLVTARDISERRAGEQALRESEARFRTMADNAPVFIWQVDPATGASYFNKRWLEFTGRRLEQEQGEGWLESVHPDDRARTLETVNAAVARRHPFEIEYRLRRADGVYRWIADRGVPRVLPDGSYAGYIGSCSDITERREADAELRYQHGLVRAITDNAASGLFMMDARGHPTFMNPAAEKITGYRLDEINDRPLHYAVHHTHPDGRPYPMEDCPIDRASAELKVVRYHEDVFVRKDGSFFPVVAHIAPLEQGGTTVGAVIEFRDVSEQKRAEEERFRLADHLRLLLESTSEGIYGVDAQGLCTFINRAGLELLGYRAEEVIGHNVHRLIHHSYADGAPYPEERCPIYRVLASGVSISSDSDLFWRKDGSAFPVEMTASPIAAPTVPAGAVVTFSDISARKEAEFEREVLLASERQARLLAEQAGRRLAFLAGASTTLATSLDYQATLKSVARLSVPEMADWCVIDVLDDAGVLERVALEHADPDKISLGHALQTRYPIDTAAKHGVAQVLRDGQPTLYPNIPDSVLQASARDDEHRALLQALGMRSAMMVPLKVRGRVVGTITLVMAESGRRYDESDLELAQELARRAAVAVDNARLYASAQDLNTSLEQRVALRTKQLEQINQELEAFAYAVSHDLRTPLSGIDGFSQALLEDYGGALDDTANHYLARIQVNTRRMGQLIDDILKLSRVSRHPPKVQTVDLSALAQDIAVTLHERYQDAQVYFRCQAGLTAEGDEGLLRIALENLLDNAWKFSAQRAGARVAFGRERQGDHDVYVVRDNGAGFDMVYAHQLFQPFHRLHSDAGFAGTGIGLVTVKRIVERHGGRIWATAQMGRGARFFFTLDADKMEGRYL